MGDAPALILVATEWTQAVWQSFRKTLTRFSNVDSAQGDVRQTARFLTDSRFSRPTILSHCALLSFLPDRDLALCCGPRHDVRSCHLPSPRPVVGCARTPRQK